MLVWLLVRIMCHLASIDSNCVEVTKDTPDQVIRAQGCFTDIYRVYHYIEIQIERGKIVRKVAKDYKR